MAGHHQHGNNVKIPEKDHQDFETDDLRRQLQQLQERLEFYENEGWGLRHHNLEFEAISDDEEKNPFHYALSHSSGGSTPPHPRHLRNLLRGYDIKADIPKFEPKMQPDDFINWLTTIERIFDFKDVPENRKVKIVAIKLRKHAIIWWEHLKRQWQQKGRDRIVTWEKMKRKLKKKKYLPNYFKQDAFLWDFIISNKKSFLWKSIHQSLIILWFNVTL